MPEHTVFVVRILFWILTGGVLLLPPRWAIFCWLLSAHINLSGPHWPSATTIGWENTIRIIILPTILLMRVGIKSSFYSSFRLLPFRIWLLICLYAMLASLWSSFFLSALKQVGYLYAYSVGFLVLLIAWRKGIISSRIIEINIWFALGFAALQTLFLGNLFGGIENRFTSFTSPQMFAEYLVAMLILVFFLPNFSFRKRFFYSIMILIQIVASGSRTGLLGALAILMVAFLIFLRRRTLQRVLISSGVILIGLILALSFFYLPSSSQMSKFRVSDLISVVKGQKSLSNIGTMSFRLNMWDATLHGIRSFSTFEYIFGRGTSSGGEVAVKSFSKYDPKTVDANRVIHNEYLRVFYEWGIFGSLVFILFLFFTVGGSVVLARRNNIGGFSLLSLAPALLIMLGVENVLAGSGSAGGIGLLLVFALAASFGRQCKMMPFVRHTKKRK